MSSPDIATRFEPYTWSMPEEAKVVAREELREEDAVREHALEQVREWLQKHPRIKNCRTDAPFLLRFLRTKKFSIPQACALLERYLTCREMYPKWFKNLDWEQPEIQELIDSGYIVPLIKRDDKNRKVVLSVIGKFDPHKHNPDSLNRLHAIITEAYLDEELNQIHGYRYVHDNSNLQMAHLSMWTLLELKNLITCIQSSSPMRLKESHFLNIPPIASKVMDYSKALLSDKLKNRVLLHKNVEELHENLSSAILPKEYGGETPMADLIAAFKEKLKETRETLLALDDMSIVLDGSSSLECAMKDELGTGVEGSFRKLNFD